MRHESVARTLRRKSKPFRVLPIVVIIFLGADSWQVDLASGRRFLVLWLKRTVPYAAFRELWSDLEQEERRDFRAAHEKDLPYYLVQVLVGPSFSLRSKHGPTRT